MEYYPWFPGLCAHLCTIIACVIQWWRPGPRLIECILPFRRHSILGEWWRGWHLLFCLQKQISTPATCLLYRVRWVTVELACTCTCMLCYFSLSSHSEKLSDCLKLQRHPVVSSEVFLSFRTLLLKFSSTHLLSFWPAIVAETVRIVLLHSVHSTCMYFVFLHNYWKVHVCVCVYNFHTHIITICIDIVVCLHNCMYKISGHICINMLPVHV